MALVFLLQCLIIACVFGFRLASLLGYFLRASKHGSKPEQLEYVAYHKGKLQKCMFGLTQKQGFPFVIRRERGYHRFLKSIGIARELQIRDEAFDREWYFITDYPDHLERALHSQGLREALRALLALPIIKLCSTPHRLWCKFDCHLMRNRTIAREDYWQKLEAVQKQISHLPHSVRGGFPFRWRAFIFLGLHMGLFITAMFGFLPTLLDNNEVISNTEWASHALIYAVPAVCLWFMVIIAFFHGTSWAGWVLADFVLTGIIGVFICSVYFVREADIHGDMQPPQRIERVVQGRSCILKCHKSCGKRCTRHSEHRLSDAECTAARRPERAAHFRATDYICAANAKYEFKVKVEHWRTDKGRWYTYEPVARVYDMTPVRARVAIPVHAGALGIQWVDTHSILPVGTQNK